ncbi:hypothetical protein T261_3622 [Streptomyces lydicus]|nr:hypothetical protein T261_3622 [Streptomyces lydicus]
MNNPRGGVERQGKVRGVKGGCGRRAVGAGRVGWRARCGVPRAPGGRRSDRS